MMFMCTDACVYRRVCIEQNRCNSQQRCFEVQQITASQSFPSFSTALNAGNFRDMGGRHSCCQQHLLVCPNFQACSSKRAFDGP